MSPSRQHAEKYLRFENDKSKGSIVGNRHYHSFFEIYYLDEGTCRYFIDSKCYDVEAGDIVLIPEGVIHHTTYQGGYHSRRLIYCSRSFIPTDVADKLPSLLYLYRCPSIADSIREIFDVIDKEYSDPVEYSRGIIAARVELLFFLLARNKNEYPNSSAGSEYVSAAIEYVKKNLGDSVKLSEAARAASVSPEHLSRTFKKETGFGFSEYVTLLRLKKAESLLSGGSKLSIAEIAYACGFNDSNYFSERFKSSYGVSPKDYRREMLKS